MNLLYQDLIAPSIPEQNANPDWASIYETLKPYGTAGEEIYLRAKTIYLLNKQDKASFIPVAKEYLSKYGQYSSGSERRRIEALLAN
jgi:hypothetical protein